MRPQPRTALAVLAAGSAAAAGGCPTAQALEPGAVRRSIPWSLVQAGPNERSLEVSFAYGGCERNPQADAAESGHGLRITVTVESPQQSGLVCPAFERLARERVPLVRPIRGRPLLGSWKVSSTGVAPARTVPRVTGLAPADARRVVAEWNVLPRLHAAVRVRHGRRGLPRVASQSPNAGAPAPRSGVVELLIDAP
jgi:hypothetical protein